MEDLKIPGPSHRLADAWLADPAFAEWLATMRPTHAPVQTLLSLCRAETLNSLDSAAAIRFHHNIQVPFMAYLVEVQ